MIALKAKIPLMFHATFKPNITDGSEEISLPICWGGGGGGGAQKDIYIKYLPSCSCLRVSVYWLLTGLSAISNRNDKIA